MPLRTAVAAYYRSQFLNTTLPGGVLGDVHRGVRHGRDVGDVGRGLRAVAWERAAGQVVQACSTVVVLLVLPSPVRSVTPGRARGVVVAARGWRVVLWPRALPRRGPSRWARGVRAAASGPARRRALRAGTWPGIVLASVVVVAGHTATFLIAARTAGVDRVAGQLLPLALLVLLAMGLPTNIGGWGPREGVGRLGVRRGRARRRAGRRHRRRLRRAGARREPAGRRRAGRDVVASRTGSNGTGPTAGRSVPAVAGREGAARG